MPTSRARRVSTPMEAAISSPRFNTFNCRAVTSAATTPTTMNGATPVKTVTSRPAIEPAFQNRMRSRLSSFVNTMALVMALSTADKAVPPSKILTGLMPLNENTMMVAIMAPTNAAITVPATLVTCKKVNDTTTANAAPALMPKIPGSASGFRVWPWINVPAVPKAAPTTMPRIVRGIRRS